jgi:hypothetical protein
VDFKWAWRRLPENIQPIYRFAKIQWSTIAAPAREKGDFMPATSAAGVCFSTQGGLAGGNCSRPSLPQCDDDFPGAPTDQCTDHLHWKAHYQRERNRDWLKTATSETTTIN